ncbi:MAG: hypothetical protein COW84_06790 [Gammaproteobacteria bacterium CG22_combo_CG10-13_8_21_14_all_40_8]|nr:MAG: hypothetical protein COW84_06790 [Gammaproteobacteria bacterium CG22_combo_CG10-13_8_21_14_all_40_8]
MSSKITQQISELMDSELTQSELSKAEYHQLLKNLCDSSENRAQWERFHLIQDLMVESDGHLADFDFAEKIALQIEKEPHTLAPTSWYQSAFVDTDPSQKRNSWIKKVFGFSVAASVAALVVTGVYQNDTNQLIQSSPTEFSAQFAPTILDVVPASVRIQTSHAPNLVQQQRLQQLFLQHSRSASEAGFRGMYPYANLISYGPVPYEPVESVVNEIDTITTLDNSPKR